MTENPNPLVDVARLIVACKLAGKVEARSARFDSLVSTAVEQLHTACDLLADQIDPERKGCWSEVRDELTREFRQITKTDKAEEEKHHAEAQ